MAEPTLYRCTQCSWTYVSQSYAFAHEAHTKTAEGCKGPIEVNRPALEGLQCRACGNLIQDARIDHHSACPRAGTPATTDPPVVIQGCTYAYDPVNHPTHYTSHPSGVECIEIVEHLGFCVGNAIKYLWRAGLKHDAIEDLKKARWYVEREIARREAGREGVKP